MRRPLTVALAASATTVAALGAGAAYGYTEPPRPAFYEAPATLPAANGAVIRSEPLTFAIDPAGLSSLAMTSTRILYRTADRKGTPIAVSGSVLVPKAPWIGLGQRPVVGYAVGTQGLADRCAPSRQQNEGFEYESIFIKGLIERGYAVAITDYQGLGTAGAHTYLIREAQGHAVIDSVRAAMKLPGSGLSTANPVAYVGYSQGGGATASAAELSASYAPELRVKGAVAGAVPADLAAVGRSLDGGMWAEFGLYGLSGLAAAYDIDVDPYLNATGRAVFADVQSHCVFDFAKNSFLRSSTLTANGQSTSELMAQEPFRSALAAQQIGRIKPAMPVYVVQSLLDDTIPYAQDRAMAKSWCGKGANVVFDTTTMPTHLGGMLDHAPRMYATLEARFAGLPQISNCWLL